MAAVTYYVALPFVRTDDGELVAGEAQEKQTATAALNEARRMAEKAAGAVAFSRQGDPGTGEFEDAKVIKTFGEVPSASTTFCPAVNPRGKARDARPQGKKYSVA